MFYITSDKLNAETMHDWAEKLAATVWPSSQKPFFSVHMNEKIPPHLVVFMATPDEKSIADYLRRPVDALIDANCDAASVSRFLEIAEKQKKQRWLGMLMTSPVIYQNDISQIFARELGARLALAAQLREKIQLVLHETVANGLIHGNLNLSSYLRQSAAAFETYFNLIAQRLKEDAYTRKSVFIYAFWDEKHLEIKVIDEGSGYDLPDTAPDAPHMMQKTGRGLKIIKGNPDSCLISNRGREVSASFLLAQSETPAVEKEAPWDVFFDKSRFPKCSVLVIEDSVMYQTLITNLLSNMGIEKIDVAFDGLQGLQTAAEVKPDLILLDITVPKMDGFEVLKKLKEKPETKNIPVVVQTALETGEIRARAFAEGAVGFMTFPLNPFEFSAKIRVHLEKQILVRNLQRQLLDIGEELKYAGQMQLAMLPEQKKLREIKNKYALDIAYSFIPSSTLGGDFWQFFEIAPGKIGLYLCDFSGHGIAASLNTVRLHTLISKMRKMYIKMPSSFLRLLNKQFYKLLPRGQYATFFFGIIDVVEKTFVYAGAGAPSPYLKKQNEGVILATKGMPLGIMANSTYDDHTVRFAPGEQLLFFSDALIESMDKSGRRIGYQRFEQLFLSSLGKSDAAGAVGQITQDFLNTLPSFLEDDITLVLVKFNESEKNT
ncbi:MAG: SpoIIE family protein phosphatase [Lactobacillales bacterium]|nr:SpoIIE family protein phosphatase [Lactobacillales bacterium]